jgi:hypothetical protein
VDERVTRPDVLAGVVEDALLIQALLSEVFGGVTGRERQGRVVDMDPAGSGE